jgi:DNA polymerase-3 subunit beta
VPKIETRIVVNKAEVESALTRASIMSKESFSNSVKMKFFNNQINITCDSEKGRCDETVSCNYDGNDILMCMNVKFLQDAIGRIKEDNFVIKAESNDRPMLITRLEGDEYRCVVMPVRMI